MACHRRELPKSSCGMCAGWQSLSLEGLTQFSFGWGSSSPCVSPTKEVAPLRIEMVSFRRHRFPRHRASASEASIIGWA
jgi:hypothetical protein